MRRESSDSEESQHLTMSGKLNLRMCTSQRIPAKPLNHANQDFSFSTDRGIPPSAKRSSMTSGGDGGH